ncbi:MAG: hypothetical protein NZT61_00045 [Deltaproteobacteria bacterium]|nr:hypothetical protein [Deltaproteobacteria bacterium]MCX7952421.1 hypothetical protein [Deltaproteobacteria bacterium]
MQGGRLITFFILSFLIAEIRIEIVPMSMSSAVDILRNESNPPLKKAIAYFSLGLDAKAFALLNSMDVPNYEERLHSLLLKAIISFRLSKHEECVKAIEELEGLGVSSANLNRLRLFCLRKLGSFDQIVNWFRSNGHIGDSASDAIIIEALLKSADLETAISLLKNLSAQEIRKIAPLLADSLKIFQVKDNLYSWLDNTFEQKQLSPCLKTAFKARAFNNYDLLNITEDLLNECGKHE